MSIESMGVPKIPTQEKVKTQEEERRGHAERMLGEIAPEAGKEGNSLFSIEVVQISEAGDSKREKRRRNPFGSHSSKESSSESTVRNIDIFQSKYGLYFKTQEDVIVYIDKTQEELKQMNQGERGRYIQKREKYLKQCC